MLCLLATAAFAGTLAFVRPWKDSGSRIEASTRPNPEQSRVPEPAHPATVDEAHRLAQGPNPAAQKAGPPDPVAEQTAADSAERAAGAAADLAASAPSPTN